MGGQRVSARLPKRKWVSARSGTRQAEPLTTPMALMHCPSSSVSSCGHCPFSTCTPSRLFVSKPASKRMPSALLGMLHTHVLQE